jgi:hypothetical protein
MDKYRVKLFEEMSELLWKNRSKLEVEEDYIDFGYPDYGGLPKRITRKLSSSAVDQIQWAVGFYEPGRTTKAQFIKVLREHLFILTL